MMPDSKRILLTGATGFVGTHLSATLGNAYWGSACFALLEPGSTNAPPRFKGVEVDLLDEAAVDALIARLRPDLIVHLAAQSSIGAAMKALEPTWRVNFHGSFALASAIARHAPEAVVVFASTAAVYGLSFRDGILNEEAALRPADAYGRSKAAAEAAFRDILSPSNRLVIARPVNHSGPGQNDGRFVLSSFAAQIAAIEAGRAEPILRVGDLSKARDFLDVRDVIDAYMRLIDTAPTFSERVAVFNIASGYAQTIASLLEEMRLRSTKDFKVEVDPQRLRPGAKDIDTVACDSSKLRELTGWSPKYSSNEMIQALLCEVRG